MGATTVYRVVFVTDVFERKLTPETPAVSSADDHDELTRPARRYAKSG